MGAPALAEAFVNTFKRDYVRVSPIPDAATALALIAYWVSVHNCGLLGRSSRPHMPVLWQLRILTGHVCMSPRSGVADHVFSGLQAIIQGWRCRQEYRLSRANCRAFARRRDLRLGTAASRSRGVS